MDGKLNENSEVYMSEDLVDMILFSPNSDKLTLRELKLLNCYLAMIDPFGKPIDDNLEVTISCKELEKFLGVTRINHSDYEEMAKGLTTKKLGLSKFGKNGDKSASARFPFFKTCELYDDNYGEHRLRMRVSDEAAKYVLLKR